MKTAGIDQLLVMLAVFIIGSMMGFIVIGCSLLVEWARQKKWLPGPTESQPYKNRVFTRSYAADQRGMTKVRKKC